MGRGNDNKAIVRRFVEATNARDYQAIEVIVAADFERQCPATPDVEVRNFDEFRRFLEREAGTFPDARVTLEVLVEEGNLVAFWATYTGTQSGPMGPFPASGRRATVDFAGVFEVEKGRISRVRLTWDNVGLLRQLGHLSAAPFP